MTIRNKWQSGLLDQTIQPRIIVLWCGWVGSAAALCLAKMWFQDITLVDKDEVENHNVASQMYKSTDIDTPKVSALKNTILEFSDVECKVFNEWWTPENQYWDFDIVILAIDNMDIRKEVVDFYSQDPFCKIIESRMWWTEYVIQVVDDYMVRLGSWFPQSEADPENCTAKAICFNTFLIWWKIGELVWKITTNKEYLNFNSYSSC